MSARRGRTATRPVTAAHGEPTGSTCGFTAAMASSAFSVAAPMAVRADV